MIREGRQCAATAWISKVGDPFAIRDICPDGRHDAEYIRFKEFDPHSDETPKANLTG